jgi:hypothetical protein
MLNSVGKWWKPLRLSPEALVHWKSAEAADPGEEGHSAEPIKILINMPPRLTMKRRYFGLSEKHFGLRDFVGILF